MSHVPLGALLGRLEASGAVLGPSWAVDGASCGPFWPSWNGIGASWAVGELR